MKNYSKLSTVLAFIVLGTACHKKEAPKEAPDRNKDIQLTAAQAKEIKLDTVKLVNEESELSLTGKVAFNEDKVSKVFPLVGGNVVKVNVSLGDYVHKGQELAVIRSGDIGDIQTQYNVALSNLQIAQKNRDISEELFKTNVNSEKDVLNARNEYKKANSDVNRLKQLLAIYGATENTNDAEYRVLAPSDGFIVEKNITENMSFRTDNAPQIFTVSFLRSVWVLADVYESDLSKIKLDEEVDVTTIAYPDKVFKGEIHEISSLLDPETKALKVRIVLDNSEGLLKPEMFASVRVHIKNSNKVLAIPTKALVFENNRFHVMVASGNNTFSKRQVEIIRSVGEKTFIKSGLSEGEQVVVKNSLLVSNNNI